MVYFQGKGIPETISLPPQGRGKICIHAALPRPADPDFGNTLGFLLLYTLIWEREKERTVVKLRREKTPDGFARLKDKRSKKGCSVVELAGLL